MNNTLSIIIPSWNTADITCRCLKSIHRHLKFIGPEIIVVDNGSTDDSVLKIKKLKSSLKVKKLKLILNSKNLGFSKANNIGAKHATGNFLFFLNSDMEIVDHSLTKMIDFLVTQKNVGVIGPKFLNPDHSPQPSVFPPQTPLNAFREFWLHQANKYSKFLPVTTKPSSSWAISGGALLIQTTVFNQIGGWDERYFFYYEDLELCRQIRNLGLDIVFFPQTTVIHRHGFSGRHLSSTSNQWRRLIPSSVKYHGALTHYLINFIIWSSQKCHFVSF